MRTDLSFALVFGGTGAVGSEILKALAREKIPTSFTYFRNREKAQTLAQECGHGAIAADLSQPGAVASVFQTLDQENKKPNLLIYSAVHNVSKPLVETQKQDWDALLSVNLHSAAEACREFYLRADPATGGDIILLSALDRTQSIPLPAAFAATQGALSGFSMALAKEYRSKKIRINVLSLGVLDGGISQQLAPQLLKDFETFSALRKRGTPTQAAEAAIWLGLRNTYMNGKVLSVNGGIG